MDSQRNWRSEIDSFLREGRWVPAQNALRELWLAQPTSATASYVLSCYERLRSHIFLRPYRVTMLRSFTIEPAIPLLRAGSLVNGLDLTVCLGDFNAYAQELLDASSQCYTSAPDVTVLAVQTRDVTPDLWERYADLSSAEVAAEVARVTENFCAWIEVFRSRSPASLVIHTLQVPPFPSWGILDWQHDEGQVSAIRQINRAIQQVAGRLPGVYVLDYDALVARHGYLAWHDEQKWLTLRMPIAAAKLVYMSKEWQRVLQTLAGSVCKVLVTDLDNTLWGSVVGEVGIDGIQVGPEYPGCLYRNLQRVMLDLHRRGVLLAICSKNNHSDAVAVLDHHPGMLLRPEHFAAVRINWEDKAQNLREIADELNVGIEALAFVDDNPGERDRVRTALPEVTVIDLPDNPHGYAQAVRESFVFERLTLSAEDRDRGRYYSEQRQRRAFARSALSLEEFYRSLQQKVTVATPTPETAGRVAQLTQKTNQWNLTTRRYSVQQINEMMGSPTWNVYAVRVQDRFGDNGVVGVMILHNGGVTWEIDTFLLSCRIIGRTVETALLAFAVEQARGAGACYLQGWFLPTPKNAPAKLFYPQHNFTDIVERNEGTLWSLDLGDAEVRCPDWIQLDTRLSGETAR
ncbi:MAG: HAD-IIIC family phosphatase [Candidatus Binatia bacterium]